MSTITFFECKWDWFGVTFFPLNNNALQTCITYRVAIFLIHDVKNDIFRLAIFKVVEVGLALMMMCT